MTDLPTINPPADTKDRLDFTGLEQRVAELERQYSTIYHTAPDAPDAPRDWDGTAE